MEADFNSLFLGLEERAPPLSVGDVVAGVCGIYIKAKG